MNKQIMFLSVFIMMAFISIANPQETYNSEDFSSEDICMKCKSNIPPAEKNNTAKALNALGMKEYRSGNLLEAARYFKCSTLEDDNFALSHYNFACMLSLLRGKDRDICNRDYVDDIKEHLIKSIQIDKNRRQRLSEDSDFENVCYFYFFRLLELNPENSLLDNLCLGSRWETSGVGLYPGDFVLSFSKNGEIKVSEFRMPENGPFGYVDFKGKFVLSGDNIIITYKNDKNVLVTFKGSIKYQINKNIFENFTIEVTTSGQSDIKQDYTFDLYSTEDCGA